MKSQSVKAAIWIVLSYFVIQTSVAFNAIASGTGSWWAEYSFKWGLLFFLYILFCAAIITFSALVLWTPERFDPAFEKIIILRNRAGFVRWLLLALIFAFPIWFLQYTPWGVVFRDIYIRLLICFFVVVASAFLIGKGDRMFGWREFLIAILLTSSEMVIAVPFIPVTDYPFSLGWSEGNRLWDYSIMFGSDLYNYPVDQKITPFLDMGRQFIGGLPFLLPVVTIEMERFWVSVLGLLPYVLLGLAAFQFERKSQLSWPLLTLWSLIFLIQGPIHPPLVLCAVGVALLWRRPLWYAIPIVYGLGYLVVNSRYTWVFAPGIWIALLEFAGASLQANGTLSRATWIRGISLGMSGVFGGYFGPKIPALFSGNVSDSIAGLNSSIAAFNDNITSSVSDQPLLWYRLLPNATYGTGILVGLLLATLPLIMILIYLAVTKKWILNIWQALIILASLLAFLGVGLIVSTKIGGGGDLHNMDMFIIGLFFVSVIAWQKSGRDLFVQIELQPVWIKFAFILLFVLPGLQSLRYMRSFNFAEDISWLSTLRDVPATAPASEKSLDMYPSREVTEESLDAIREEVDLALSQGGEVLFLDQRQLLTFGYITNVPLVPEYEKKVLMNQALSSNQSYFEGLYADLAAHRFQLIVSEPLRTPIKDSSFEFGEENNAWVKWVSAPVLCYYEEKDTLKEVGVQLLVPNAANVDCTAILP